ncbi:unnamed protein product [Acidithrix sp. C25]|nr:unnamed protein product [Acidithrix sp. C25]
MTKRHCHKQPESYHELTTPNKYKEDKYEEGTIHQPSLSENLYTPSNAR